MTTPAEEALADAHADIMNAQRKMNHALNLICSNPEGSSAECSMAIDAHGQIIQAAIAVRGLLALERRR
jgi:hypothetical protein